MNYLTKFFTSGKPAQSKHDDVLQRNMPEDMQESMICFTMGDVELYHLKPRATAKGPIKQDKECRFLKASINITSIAIDVDDEPGAKINIPVVQIINDNFEEDQEQEKVEKLPITEELTFMKYSDGADEEDGDSFLREIKNGYVFFYPSINMCKVIECTITSEQVAEELRQFEDWICKVLFITNEEMPLVSTTNKAALAKQNMATSKYCIPTQLAILLRTSNLQSLFQSDSASVKTSATEETKEVSARRKRAQAQRSKNEAMS